MDQQISEVSTEELLEALLEIAEPLAPFDMPLLDAHGASLAEDIYAGDELLLKSGTRLRSAQIALAASLGLNRLPTRPHPRVVIISAGDDLVEPGQQLSSYEDEFETNSWMLTTAVREAGATAYRVHTIPENEEQLQLIIEDQLVRADLIVISGESHDESFELITSVLNKLGSVTAAIPRMSDTGAHNYGLIGPDKTPVVTLPGDPVAAFISAEVFIRPMIRTMLGAKTIFRSKVTGVMKNSAPSAKGVRSFVRATLAPEGNSYAITALADQGNLLALSNAMGLIMVNEERESFSAGDKVDVLLLERSNN
jgi:molybdopterin biosynthesis enzyme